MDEGAALGDPLGVPLDGEMGDVLAADVGYRCRQTGRNGTVPSYQQPVPLQNRQNVTVPVQRRRYSFQPIATLPTPTVISQMEPPPGCKITVQKPTPTYPTTNRRQQIQQPTDRRNQTAGRPAEQSDASSSTAEVDTAECNNQRIVAATYATAAAATTLPPPTARTPMETPCRNVDWKGDRRQQIQQ